MQHTENPESAKVVLHPAQRLLTHGIAARLALTLPILGAIFWLGIPTGQWWIAIAIEVPALAVSLSLIVAFRRTGIELGHHGVHERGFFGGQTFACADQVGTVLLVDVYQPNSQETKPNLFVVDHHGRRLLRMRGQFWSREKMQLVADRLDVEITSPVGPMTIAELAQASPKLLYWFERLYR